MSLELSVLAEFTSHGGPLTGVDKPSKSELYDLTSIGLASALAVVVLFGVERDEVFGLLEFV